MIGWKLSIKSFIIHYSRILSNVNIAYSGVLKKIIAGDCDTIKLMRWWNNSCFYISFKYDSPHLKILNLNNNYKKT